MIELLGFVCGMGQAKGRWRDRWRWEKIDCREGIENGFENLHIDGGESTVGDGAADSTGNGESGVKGSAAELLGSLSLDDGSNWGGSGHCECLWG